jgi:hypothetical protein
MASPRESSRRPWASLFFIGPKFNGVVREPTDRSQFMDHLLEKDACLGKGWIPVTLFAGIRINQP